MRWTQRAYLDWLPEKRQPNGCLDSEPLTDPFGDLWNGWCGCSGLDEPDERFIEFDAVMQPDESERQMNSPGARPARREPDPNEPAFGTR